MRAGLPHLRSAVATAGAATLLLVGAPAALAAPGTGSGGDAAISVASSCNSVQVSSSKAISNVVLEFADGDRQRFEDLPASRNGTFAGTGEHDGEVIETVWVKSGNNKSGDGPGYGERFDVETGDCETDPTTTTTGNDPQGETDPDIDDEQDTDGAPEDDQPEGDEPQGHEQPRDEPEGDGTAGDPKADAPTAVGADSQERARVDDADKQGNDSDDAADGPSTAVASTSSQRDEATASPDLAPQVLGVVLDREVAAASGAEILTAAELPATGSDALTALLAALGSIGLGAVAVRRTRSN